MPHLLVALIRRLAASPLTALCVACLARLITRILARQLQMPEALVHDAGRYLYARVDTFERQLLYRLLGKCS